MKPVLVIADDLTGAADTGVCFTRAGLSAVIAFSPEDEPEADVLVFTTESRSAMESEARGRIRRLLPRARDAGMVYKKIDSTLRGFPGAELAELVTGLGIEKALVAPAFPAQGRTTLGGKQMVHGLPIEHSSFQSEVAGSDLAAFFGVCGLPVRLIPLNALRSSPAEIQRIFSSPGPAVFIGDAETEADLHLLAGVALQSGLRLFCGSAGLARALADHFPRPTPAAQRPLFEGKREPILGADRRGADQGVGLRRASLPPDLPPVLGVVGSRNPATVGQVAAARDAGVCVVEIDPDFGPGPGGLPGGIFEPARAALSQGRDAILALSSAKDSSLAPLVVAERLAQETACFIRGLEIGGLVLSGGEIAMAVLSALHAVGLRLVGEFLPGMPLAILVGGERPDLPLITKAGGFGERDALLKAVQYLRAR